MSKPPRDRLEFWIRFIGTFFVFGVISAVCCLNLYHSWGLTKCIAVGVVATLLPSTYAAFSGDNTWLKIMDYIRWW